MNFVILALIIAVQLILSLGVTFTAFNKRPVLLLLSLCMNLLLGISIPIFLVRLLWAYMLEFFRLDRISGLLHQPLTGATALCLFTSIFLPLLYFKWVCLPLVRDASQNYNNYARLKHSGHGASEQPESRSRPYKDRDISP